MVLSYFSNDVLIKMMVSWYW